METENMMPAHGPLDRKVQPLVAGCPADTVVDRVTLLETDLPKLVIAGQLSRRTSFQVCVYGFFDAKEQQALMRILSAQLDVLGDGDAT